MFNKKMIFLQSFGLSLKYFKKDFLLNFFYSLIFFLLIYFEYVILILIPSQYSKFLLIVFLLLSILVLQIVLNKIKINSILNTYNFILKTKKKDLLEKINIELDNLLYKKSKKYFYLSMIILFIVNYLIILIPFKFKYILLVIIGFFYLFLLANSFFAKNFKDFFNFKIIFKNFSIFISHYLVSIILLIILYFVSFIPIFTLKLILLFVFLGLILNFIFSFYFNILIFLSFN